MLNRSTVTATLGTLTRLRRELGQGLQPGALSRHDLKSSQEK
jgi:hypothetical protein